MMRSVKKVLFLLLAGTFTFLSGTTVGYIYPAGARAGSTVQVIVGGQGLWAVKDLLADLPGIKLVRIQSAPGVFYAGCGEQQRWAREYLRRVFAGEHLQPLRKNPKNFGVWRYNHFMEQLDQLDPLMLSLACKGLFKRPNSLQASPAIAQKLVLTLQIDNKAVPGVREIRLAGRDNNLRCTNPLLFYIGREPEFQEQYFQMPPLKKNPVFFTIPSAVNGQIEPGETDFFKFRLKKGEKCHFKLLGRKLNPFIGDGVPGNFQPVLEVKDEKNKSLAFADDNYFDPDPVLDFQAPADGVYTLVIRDALYRGREDFVYRIDVRPGEYRRPALKAPELGIPEICEHLAAEKPLLLPALISGTLDVPGKGKTFRFHADAGKEFVAEVFARRVGSPLDPLLTVYGPDGKQIAVNDDFERPNIGLNMQHVDSYLRIKAPVKGVYTVKIADTAGAGGKDFGFFLRLDRVRPDFRVYMVPSGVWVSSDRGADPVKVVVEKLDGFDGEISFELKNSGNVSLTGIRSIPAGASESMLSLSAYWMRKFLPVRGELYAVHKGKRRRVIGADAAMQAFAYTHYVPARKLLFMSTWLHSNGNSFAFPAGFDHRITLKPGKEVTVPVAYRAVKAHESPQGEFTLPDAPKGVALKVKHAQKDLYLLTFAAEKNAPRCDVNIPVKVRYSYKYFDRKRKEMRKNATVFHLPMLRLTVR